MKNFRFHMMFQWLLFMPVILPVCLLFGALRGAYQMGERVLDQFMIDVAQEQTSERIA
jgi:hypothetical protein